MKKPYKNLLQNSQGYSFLILIFLLSLFSNQGFSQSKSVKRGIGYGQHSAEDMKALAPGISWWYNWAPTPESGASGVYVQNNVAFVPMVWGGTPNADQLVAAIPQGAQFLLGFNEPNFISQANMTPSQVAQRWPILEDVARRRNLKLVSPAVNYCGDCVSENGVTFTDPVQYLDAFFAACSGCKVDYIAVHWYACDAGALEWYVGRFKKYNKPIWVTEFACGDNPHNTITLDVQKNYMTAAVKYLESDPSVFRYSWFSGRNNEIPNINLLGTNGQLTELGRLYVGLPFTTSQPPATGKLIPVGATSSSVQSASMDAAKAIDGDLSTRWSSAFADPQFLRLDFGATKSFSRVKINWEGAYGRDYQIQTSNDGSAWTTIKSVVNGDGGIDDNTGLTGSGRYLRVYGTRRGTTYGYSIFEIETYSGTTNTTETLLSRTNSAVASSVENSGTAASYAVDANNTTRWASAFSDPQWIYQDLGSVKNISRVRLLWEAAFGVDYEIQGSNDAVSWSTVQKVVGGNGGEDNLTGLNATARYVRVYGTRRATSYGYSLFSFEVYGPASTARLETSLNPSLGLDESVGKIVLFSNPTSKFNIRIKVKDLNAQDHQVSLLNIDGGVCYRETVSSQILADGYTLEPSQNIRPGLYFIVVKSGKEIVRKKIILE